MKKSLRAALKKQNGIFSKTWQYSLKQETLISVVTTLSEYTNNLEA